MSGHCKSCDCILSDDDMIKKDVHGHYTELCSYCIVATDQAERSPERDLAHNEFYYTGRRSAHLHND